MKRIIRFTFFLLFFHNNLIIAKFFFLFTIYLLSACHVPHDLIYGKSKTLGVLQLVARRRGGGVAKERVV